MIGETFYKFLRLFRLVMGETQEEFIRKTGYDKTMVSMLENGKRMLDLETLLQLARLHNINPNGFFNTDYGTIIRLFVILKMSEKNKK